MDADTALDQLTEGNRKFDDATARHLIGLASPILRQRASRRCVCFGIKREELRQEVAQDAIVRVLKYWKKYRGSSAREFNTWFARICDSVAANCTRRIRRGREAVPGISPAMDVDCQGGPGDAAEGPDPETFALLFACLAELVEDDSHGYHAVILLYNLQLTVREAAEILDAPNSTVFSWKKRAFAALAECLRRKGVT